MEWSFTHAQEFNGDPTKIAVGGDSAGGSLAAVVALMVRDRNPEINLSHQLLVYPCVTDPTTDSIESHNIYKDGPVVSILFR